LIDLQQMFCSFTGRLGRREFWRGALMLLAAELALLVLLAAIAGLDWSDFAPRVRDDYGSVGRGGATQYTRKVAVVYLVTFAVFFWPSLALAVKRLHDRGLPGWWAGLFHVLMLLCHARMALSSPPLLRDVTKILIYVWPLALVTLLGFWLIYEMAVMPGQRGDNRFGADPRGPDPGRRPEPINADRGGLAPQGATPSLAPDRS
jgi:uncharacterized membrane protein YhaH (DUF805 family)